jgi:threonine aldolase
MGIESIKNTLILKEYRDVADGTFFSNAEEQPHRVIVLSDIEADADDVQSLCRFVTSWATTDAELQALDQALAEL